LDGIEKLWESDDDRKQNRVRAGTAIRLLEQLPIQNPPQEIFESEIKNDVIPKAPIKLTGLAGCFYDLLVDATERQPGRMQIAGALAALSALAGPNTVIQNGTSGPCCTNLYLLSLAHTGSGKESIRTLISTVLKTAERSGEVMSASPSHVSFHAHLQQNEGRCALLIDEAGMLANVIKSGSQSLQQLLFSKLMEVYGLGLTQLEAVRYKDRKQNLDAVEKPRPTLLLTSTVDEFVRGSRDEDSANGWLNRLLPFVDSELPPLKDRQHSPNKSSVIDLPDDVVAAVERLKGQCLGPALRSMPVIKVTLTEQARQRAIEFKRKRCVRPMVSRFSRM
jgi:hypothetical protein